MITTQEIKAEAMVSQGGEQESGLQAIVEPHEVNNNQEKPGFKDSPEGIEEMRCHWFDMMNPERLRTSAPLDEAYKREAIKQAEAFLINEGHRLIFLSTSGNKPAVNLFPGL